MSILIKNVNIVNSTGVESSVDIYIENSIIKDIKKNLDIEVQKIIDARGLYVLPGLVDAHCHLRDPGYEYKEDISTGSRSAARGGFTSIACMPNTDPVADNPAVVTYIIEKAKKEALVNVYPIGAITKGQKGRTG